MENDINQKVFWHGFWFVWKINKFDWRESRNYYFLNLQIKIVKQGIKICSDFRNFWKGYCVSVYLVFKFYLDLSIWAFNRFNDVSEVSEYCALLSFSLLYSVEFVYKTLTLTHTYWTDSVRVCLQISLFMHLLSRLSDIYTPVTEKCK